MNRMGRMAGALMLACALTLLGSCAAPQPKHEDALALMAQGRYEEGIAQLERDVRNNPGDFKNRTDLINARERALNRLLAEAADARASGEFDRAVPLYRRALGIDAGNERARTGLADIERDRTHAEDVAQARKLYDDGDIEGAASRVQSVLREDPAQRQAQELKRRIEEKRARELASMPTLRSMYDGPPLTMKFRDADLRQVFDVLSRESGVTIVFDRDVKPDLRATIVARQIAFEDAFDLLLMKQPARQENHQPQHRAGLPGDRGKTPPVPGPRGKGFLPDLRGREADGRTPEGGAQAHGDVRRRENEHDRAARYARGDFHRRETDRHARPGGAGSHARSGSAGSPAQSPGRSRHPVAEPVDAVAVAGKRPDHHAARHHRHHIRDDAGAARGHDHQPAQGDRRRKPACQSASAFAETTRRRTS